MPELSYRTKLNAEAMARVWGKSLDAPDWYSIKAMSDDETEVLIYDVIGWPFNTADAFVRDLAATKAKTITVRINSPGGDVFDGLAIFNALQAHGAKVITRIEGLAASISSIIALAGREVQMQSNAMFMIHEPFACACGNSYEHREVADLLEKISGNLVDVYAANSNVGKRELKAMLKAETWLTAKEAKEKGFVDTILEGGKPAKANADLSIFARAPDMRGDAEDSAGIASLQNSIKSIITSMKE